MDTHNPFNNFSKIYCVNLEERQDRWEKCLEYFRKYNIPFERFNAIKPNQFQTNQENGRYGCISSFCSIVRDAIDKDYENILVLEDDFEFTIEPEELYLEINKSVNELPEDWDCLYLGGNIMSDFTFRPIEKYSDNLLKLKSAYSTHAMAFSNMGLINLISYFSDYNNIEGEMFREYGALDIFFARDYLKDHQSFIPTKMLCVQRDSFSTIEGAHCSYKQSLVERLELFKQYI